MRHLSLLAVVLAGSLLTPAFARQGSQAAKDLSVLTIEDLMNMKVTSVSKKEQKLSRTAAAIFVITQEDIRRSGATTIPDLLRMVPGLDVGQINGSTYAISSRGFNGQFSNKLLVMIDRRIVYTPNFAGVYWDTLDVPFADIDRIEVIRGPGGTTWGANAVNGIISIFTKHSSETHGAMIETGGGNLDQGFGTMQYGGKLGSTDYRIYSKYFNRDHLTDLSGQNGRDGWRMLRGGFRTDTALSRKDSLMVEADLYTGQEGQLGYDLPSVTSPGFVATAEQIEMRGGSIQANWNHVYSSRSDSSLQVSFWRYTRGDPLEPEGRNTLDIDYQQDNALGRHDLVWGLGYRDTSDKIGGSLTVSFDPPSRSLQLFSSFVQDEIALVPDRVYLTAGIRLEHNDYTGFEVMPSVRVAWIPSQHHMFWSAVSRAVRAPSRNDANLIVNIAGFPGADGTPNLVRLTTNPDFKDEHLIAYEIGSRATITGRLSLDLAAYYNTYRDVATVEPTAPFFEGAPLPAHLVLPSQYQNLMYGETHGLEVAANWKLTSRWTLSPGYALELLHMHTEPGSSDIVTGPFIEGGTPRHSAQLRSHVDLLPNLSWDTFGSFTGRLENQGLSTHEVIPSYTRLDQVLTWKAHEWLSISLVGQNLLKDHHIEFEDVFGSMQAGQIKRSGYAKMTWHF